MFKSLNEDMLDMILSKLINDGVISGSDSSHILSDVLGKLDNTKQATIGEITLLIMDSIWDK